MPASGSEGLGSVGRDGSFRNRGSEGSLGHGLENGERVGLAGIGEIVENKKPRFRWEAGRLEILGFTRLSDRSRSGPASGGLRNVGKGHPFGRQRAVTLNLGTDRPEPKRRGLDGESGGALEDGTVETHRSGLKLAIDMDRD